MARTIDLTSKEWLDLVFANKNQEYGAYKIRKTSSKRHLASLAIVIFLCVAFSVFPTVMSKLFPAETEVVNPDDTGRIKLITVDIPENKIIDVKQPEPIVNPAPLVKFTPPVIRPDDQVAETEQMLTQIELSNPNVGISTINREGVTGGTDFTPTVIVDPKITETPFIRVEEMPTFPGGEKELMSYLSRNIKYPVIAQEQGIQGNVVLRFVVDKKGDITDVTILRSLDPSCDKEAVRVVKSMPKWIPGKQNGTPVPVYYTIPVRFKLQ
ncbi:MAG: TonB family protein [Dysgonamonadaceae bacterium]|jgi:protein TonB|nr:TonB family protein [Dysgonamonadaceae bacterium]